MHVSSLDIYDVDYSDTTFSVKKVNVGGTKYNIRGLVADSTLSC